MTQQASGALSIPTLKIQPLKFTTDELNLVAQKYFPGNPKDRTDEWDHCIQVAQNLALNPIMREIFFIPRKTQDDKNRWIEKIEPMVGRDGFLTIAHRTGQFAGIETNVAVEDVPYLDSGNNWITKPDLVATSTVWRKDSNKPTVVRVSYREYVQTTMNGNITKFWRMPQTMLGKVADSQSLRKAFNICGVYCPEELRGDIVVHAGMLTDEDVPPGAKNVTTPTDPVPQSHTPKPEPPREKPQEKSLFSMEPAPADVEGAVFEVFTTLLNSNFKDCSGKEKELKNGTYNPRGDFLLIQDVKEGQRNIGKRVIAFCYEGSGNEPLLQNLGFSQDTANRFWIKSFT